MNVPQFILEREAWYKAGAHAIGGFMFIAALAVGATISIAGLFWELSPLQAVIGYIGGTWFCLAILSIYINVKARDIATKGGVHVDRF
jgi:hypothetical protein